MCMPQTHNPKRIFPQNAPKNVILAEWFTFTFNHWCDSQNDLHSEARACSQLHEMENAAKWSIFPPIWGTNYYVTPRHVVYLNITSSQTKNKHFESWCFCKQFSTSVFLVNLFQSDSNNTVKIFQWFNVTDIFRCNLLFYFFLSTVTLSTQPFWYNSNYGAQ